MKLTKDFYTRPNVVQVAQELLGKHIYTSVDGILTGGMIVETEAYSGDNDRACHAHLNRRTARTEIMYHEGGVAYVYLVYGIYNLFNIITNIEGKADAVLVRAIEPEIGSEEMLLRRNMPTIKPNLTAGPGVLSIALGINRKHYGKDHLLPQDFADMQGWKELTGITKSAYQLIPASEKQHTLILCDNYGQAGAINFYATKTLPPAVSYNADYIYWFPDLDGIKHIILVKGEGEAPLQESEKPFIQRVKKIGSINNTYAREVGTTVYLLTGIHPTLKEALYHRLAVMQSKPFPVSD